MTKRTYVMRDGELVEKVRPEPEVFEMLPWPAEWLGPSLAEALRGISHQQFRALYEGRFTRLKPSSDFEP